MYPLAVAADLLDSSPDALRKKAARGTAQVQACSPADPRNPLAVWLFDAEDVDRTAGSTSRSAVWLQTDDRDLAIDRISPSDLADRYREQLELRTAEAFAEREARLVAEREVVARERDAARTELERVRHTVTAFMTAMFAEHPGYAREEL
jgi:hypothetical protein